MRSIAGRHGVELVAAALQFSFALDVASTLIVSTDNPAHILANHAELQARIPPAISEELHSTGILHHYAAVPANKD